MSITPSDVDTIKQALSGALLDVHTALPGCVVKYDAASQTADIQLEVNRTLDRDDVGRLTTEQLPELPDIPIIFPGVGDYSITFPINVGDPVMVIFCESSIDSWRVKGGITNPGDIRRHSLGNAVAIPGLRPDAKAIADPNNTDLTIARAGGQKLTVKSSTVEVSDDFSADDFVAMAGKVLTELGRINTLIGSTWVPVAMDGGAALKAAWTAAFPAGFDSVASSNLKADD